ncbi:MAG: TonB-dependent hemoglobin/transferrin/lactoferrin family receptor [Ahniella sp.]|nr:TonB-dependent hemoglobin/transferrin/lactoferrin family receptor [Ahniella sp.]
MGNKNVLMMAILAALSMGLHAADDPIADTAAHSDQNDAGITRLETIVSVGNHRDQMLGQVAGTVSVIEHDQNERHLAQDLADLVRYEPGISVVEETSRFGASGFSIRGLDGNRVGMSVDGVPVRDAFAVGSFSRGTRNAVEPALLSRTEMLRGPASTLHGSEALAGVVNFHTLSPQDLLEDVAGDFAVRARAGANGRDDSVTSSASAAQHLGQIDWLLALVDRQGHERSTQPRPGGLSANPQDRHEQTGLLKLRSDLILPGTLALTLEQREADINTDLRSFVRGPAQYASTNAMSASDAELDQRASLTFEWPAGIMGLDALNSSLSMSRSRIDQNTQQWRDAEPPRTPANRRDRRFLFEQDSVSADLLGERRTSWFGAEHWFVFGLSMNRQSAEELRDGRETNLVTGAVSTMILGERFPVRDFPDTVSTELGLFWQDEIQLGEQWALIPGLRWERFNVDARPDVMYVEDNPNQRPVDLDDAALTPKLGARWQASEALQIFGQYAEGFRLPPAGDLNIGFNIPAFNYVALPNPDLQPEHSRGLELGARWSGSLGHLEIVAFENRYRNLIESRVNLGRNDQGQLVFQSQNRARASIRGIELRGESALPWAGFSLQGGLAYTEGSDTVRDVPLNSIDPAKATLGVIFESANARHRIELVGTAIARQDQVAPSSPAAFETPGVGLVDLYWNWRLGDHLNLDVGAFNLTDRRWWAWGSVRGIAVDAREIDLATQPGRHLAMNLEWRW